MRDTARTALRGHTPAHHGRPRTNSCSGRIAATRRAPRFNTPRPAPPPGPPTAATIALVNIADLTRAVGSPRPATPPRTVSAPRHEVALRTRRRHHSRRTMAPATAPPHAHDAARTSRPRATSQTSTPAERSGSSLGAPTPTAPVARGAATRSRSCRPGCGCCPHRTPVCRLRSASRHSTTNRHRARYHPRHLCTPNPCIRRRSRRNPNTVGYSHRSCTTVLVVPIARIA